jgi:hypothetical protein
VAPYAVTVQMKTEAEPTGQKKGAADLSRVFNILRAAHYRGYVALEYEAAEDPMTAVPRYLKQMQALTAGER